MASYKKSFENPNFARPTFYHVSQYKVIRIVTHCKLFWLVFCFFAKIESTQTDIKTFSTGCVKYIAQEQDEKNYLIMFQGCVKGIGKNGGAPVFIKQTSQELRMLSSVTINCKVTKIVMNPGSQLSVL